MVNNLESKGWLLMSIMFTEEDASSFMSETPANSVSVDISMHDESSLSKAMNASDRDMSIEFHYNLVFQNIDRVMVGKGKSRVVLSDTMANNTELKGWCIISIIFKVDSVNKPLDVEGVNSESFQKATSISKQGGRANSQEKNNLNALSLSERRKVARPKDKDKIFGYRIGSQKIDRVMGPPGILLQEMEYLYNAALDVPSIAGRDPFCGNLVSSEHLLVIQDDCFKATNRHIMSTVKNQEDFANYLRSFVVSSESVFEVMTNSMKAFLCSLHFKTGDINVYLYGAGLLPKISRDSFEYFQELLFTIQENDSLNGPIHVAWERSLGKAMFDLHSNKLFDIRKHAVTRKELILKTYCFLRESKRKSFFKKRLVQKLSLETNAIGTEVVP